MVITPNYSIGPDGRSSVTLLSGESDALGLWQSVNTQTSGIHTLSVFVKPEFGSRDLILKINDQVSVFPGGLGIPLPNGWYECKISSIISSESVTCSIILGNGDGSLQIFGASFFSGTQGEYIPTVGSPVTATDYHTQQPEFVIFSSAPDDHDTLLWTGSYQYERRLVSKTVMSQYANSPRILSMINTLGDALDLSRLNSDFYDMVVNVNTARGVGLDIWGRIVGVSREINVANPEGKYFGFSDGFYPFNEYPFSSGGQGADTWPLTDHAYRDLIFLKAISNIVYATAPNINALLRYAFKGSSYFLLHNNMTASYVFEFFLSPFERHIVYNTDILPRPCGVLIDYIELDPSQTFGFYGTGFAPFNQGVFAT